MQGGEFSIGRLELEGTSNPQPCLSDDPARRQRACRARAASPVQAPKRGEAPHGTQERAAYSRERGQSGGHATNHQGGAPRTRGGGRVLPPLPLSA